MTARASKTTPHTQFHKDGSIWAKGQHLDGAATGYWEWYRKDGTRLRSGTFDHDTQVGEWTTYDQRGEPYKVTVMKPTAPTSSSKASARQAPKRVRSK